MTRSPIQADDRDDIAEFIARHWGTAEIICSGRRCYPHREEGFVERRDGRIVGVVTFRIAGDQVHVLTLNSTLAGQGIGTALLLRVIELARERDCRRLWLTTTNDNLRAIGLYQRLGFRLVAVHPGAIDEARRLKPAIPLVGDNGIPIRDELVMELRLEPLLDGAAHI